MTDLDSLGPDGSVQLRVYAPLARTSWVSACCAKCQRIAALSVPAAIAAMGSGEATVL